MASTAGPSPVIDCCASMRAAVSSVALNGSHAVAVTLMVTAARSTGNTSTQHRHSSRGPSDPSGYLARADMNRLDGEVI